MFTIVKNTEVFTDVVDFTNFGNLDEFVRGYSIEVKDNTEESTYWLNMEYFYGEPEDYFTDYNHKLMYEYLNVTPTGRISFRGYGQETYDIENNRYYITPITPFTKDEEQIEEFTKLFSNFLLPNNDDEEITRIYTTLNNTLKNIYQRKITSR